MSKTTSVPAVGYVRRSSDSATQAKSLPEQTAEVQRYADEKGYHIVRWYTDDAISGDDTTNRKGFLQMLADARERGDFRAIICWDIARFGRFDSQEWGYHTYPLRMAGVYLATVMDGVRDWNDASGRIVANVLQEGKHQQLIDHSANVVRGLKGAVENGGWIGSPPYAYRIEGERKAKRLVVDDPGKVNIVRRIFREFVDDGRGLADIAQRLNNDGTVSPNANPHGWHHETIKVILSNPAYAGDFVSGRQTYGKYHRLKRNEVVKVSGERRGDTPETEWTIRRDTHESIIDRVTYERAKAILERVRVTRQRRKAPEKQTYPLAGAMRCGKCGGPLHAMRGGTGKRVRYYECAKSKRFGDDICQGTTVREGTVLLSVADFLEGWLNVDELGTAAYYGGLKPGDLPEAFDKVRELLAPKTMPKKDRSRMEKELTQLTAQVTKAKANVVLLDAENIPAAQETIRGLETRRSELEGELRKATPAPEKDINAAALEVLHNLVNLAYCCRALARDESSDMVTVGSLESAAPAALRRFLGQTAHIVCHTVKEGRKTRTRHVFKGGEVVFTAVGVNASDLNPRCPGKSRILCH